MIRIQDIPDASWQIPRILSKVRRDGLRDFILGGMCNDRISRLQSETGVLGVSVRLSLANPSLGHPPLIRVGQKESLYKKLSFRLIWLF